MPGVSWVFIWPLLFALAAIGIDFMWPALSPWRRAGVLALGAVPAVLFLAALVVSFHTALTVHMIPVPIAFVVLLLGLLLPHLELAAAYHPGRWALPIVAGVVALACLLGGSLTAGFDAAHPRPNTIFYGLDADQGRAYWIGLADPDDWTSQFLPAGQVQTLDASTSLPFQDVPASSAPVLEAAPPRAELLAATAEGEVRTLRLRVSSARGAPLISLFLDLDTEVISVTVAGKPLAPTHAINLATPPPEGFELELKVRGAGPLRLTVVDQTYGLPTLAGVSYRPRPPDMMEQPSHTGDATLVSKRSEF